MGEWKIIGACPAYEVSSEGRVRRSAPGKRTRVGNILKPNKTGGHGKYLGVTLVMNGKRIYVTVHRLVCRAFHGDPPSPLHEAAHRDGDHENNCEKNLYWATRTENAADKARHGTTARGERVGGAKLTEEDVIAIRSKHNGRRFGYAETAIEYGVDKTLIAKIVRKDIWRHVTS